MISRWQFLAAGAAIPSLVIPKLARAGRLSKRYQFACEQSSGYGFLVDAPSTPVAPHPSIADKVRAGALKQRERVEFPFGDGDTMRSVLYYEDPAKPFAAENTVPSGDPRILIEIFTDVTSILVKREPFPHFLAMGLVVDNPTSSFFGNLSSRPVIFSAALDPEGSTGMSLLVASVASSHVLGAQRGSGKLEITEGGLR